MNERRRFRNPAFASEASLSLSEFVVMAATFNSANRLHRCVLMSSAHHPSTREEKSRMTTGANTKQNHLMEAITCRPGIAPALNLPATLLFCASDDATMASTCCWAATEASRAAARTIDEKLGADGAAILLAFEFVFRSALSRRRTSSTTEKKEGVNKETEGRVLHSFFSSQLGFPLFLSSSLFSALSLSVSAFSSPSFFHKRGEREREAAREGRRREREIVLSS